ncbi:unnamed protein product [Boreogadus saida]
MMDIFYTHGSPEVIFTDQGREFWNKTTGDLPDDVDIASPDKEDIEKYVQATAESDGKVTANIQKAQERQKEAYKRRTKRGTKRFRITPGMEVTDNNLVQLETLDGKPLKTRTPYASVKPVQRRSQAAWPTKETVSNISVSADSKLEEDPLEDCDVVITSVQPGQTYPASPSKRVEDFRAMLSNPSTWLDDHAMDHAQALLKAEYPNGLYATSSLPCCPL